MKLFRSQLYSELAYVLLSHINSRFFSSRYFSFLAFIYSLSYIHMTRSMLISNIISSSSIYSERSRFQKILDSSLFINEKNSIWKNWYEKVQNKLEINVNLFSSERVKLSYVHFKLFNDAAEITQLRRERDCFNLYKIVDELLKELAQLFDDSDKEVNFCKNYYNLIQEQKKFSEFYTQFQRLFFYLDY